MCTIGLLPASLSLTLSAIYNYFVSSFFFKFVFSVDCKLSEDRDMSVLSSVVSQWLLERFACQETQ